MKNKKKIQLSILYTRKITIAGEGTLCYEKEFLIRRTGEQYALKTEQGIRYVIFKDARENDKYIAVGRMTGGNKYKNYYLSSFEGKQILKNLSLLPNTEITSDILSKTLQSLLIRAHNHSLKFKTFVKNNFSIDYDNPKS